MKSQPLLHPQGLNSTQGEHEFCSSGKFITKNSTLTSEHSTSQSNFQIFNRPSHQHKLNNKTPLFCFKKKEVQKDRKTDDMIIRTEYSVHRDDEKSIKSQQSNSQKRSHDKNQLKPTKLARFIPQISEFTSQKRQKGIQTFSKAVWEECSVHRETKYVVADMQEKISNFIARMNEVEQENKKLQNSLMAKHRENQNKSQNVVKLLQEYEELEGTRRKWLQGKQNLECLSRELNQKMEREKLAEKENMGKEDCESYFKSNSKQKIVQKTDLSDKNEYRGKLLQRLNIKIEKT